METIIAPSPTPVKKPVVPITVKEKQHQEAVEDAAAQIAVTVPLPGATADAFAPKPDIKVGPYLVRPFYDIDYEFLQSLEHPLFRIRALQMAGQKVEETLTPMGLQAWQLCWILTRPVEEVEKAFIEGEGKNDLINQRARQEFGKYQLGALEHLCKAAIRQLEIYWSTTIGYDAAAEDKEKGEASNAPANPPSA